MEKSIFTINDSLAEKHSVFGIRLESIPAKRGKSLNQNDNLNQLQTFTDLINQLYITEIPVTFSLRSILSIDGTEAAPSSLDIILFVNTRANSGVESRKNALSLLHQTNTILQSSFPNHQFSFIGDQKTFMNHYKPNWLNDAHFCEVRKRESLVLLNKIAFEHPMGFTSEPVQPSSSEIKNKETIYFTHPFLPRLNEFERLYRILIHNHQDFIVNISLTPAILKADEDEALTREIARCEGYEPVRDIPVRQLYLERAKLLLQGLMDQYLRLQDAPFFLQIHLASQKPIHRAIAEAIGGTISQSIGSDSFTERVGYRMQMGGYDILFPSNDSDRSSAKNDFLHPGLTSWGKTLAPEPLKRLRFLVDGYQGASAFRFPTEHSPGLLGIKVRQSKQIPVPVEMTALKNNREMVKKIIGKNDAFGLEQPIYLTEKDLSQHMYVVGQTGTGKTTLLKSMILGDINNNKGVALIDPHGDLFDELIALIPKHRIKDVILLNPLDMAQPVGFNLLECSDKSQRTFIAREIKAIMHRLLHDTFGSASDNYIGPIFYKHVQMNLLLAMSDPKDPGTLLEFYEIFQHENYWRRWLPLKWKDPMLTTWVEEVLPQMDYTYRPRSDNVSMGEYVGSKFDDFVLDPRLRLIFAQKESTINLKNIMDEGKILLINLAKGLLGEATAQFLGLILMAKFQSEILSRSNQPLDQRRPFTLYVDEFQSLATENFTLLLSEARKFGVSLVLANQFVSQIKDPRILEAIFGNVGTMLAFRVGKNDAASIEPQFAPQFNQYDLANLPNWHACAKMTINGQVVPPFNLTTILPDVEPNPEVRERVLEHSRRVYGRPREEVETIIRESLKPYEPKPEEGQEQEPRFSF
jgi:hypothetical protein